jgi:magnesium-transporting ATPase (P-type)
MQVRLVSGDHIETAKAVALKAGILKPEEHNVPYAVMTSSQFREFVGEVVTIEKSDGTSEHVVENLDNFRECSNKLRVLARATAADKYLLTVGL